MMFSHSFCVNSNADAQGRSGIQFKFQDGGNSNKSYSPLQNNGQKNKGKEGGEVRTGGSACMVKMS